MKKKKNVQRRSGLEVTFSGETYFTKLGPKWEGSDSPTKSPFPTSECVRKYAAHCCPCFGGHCMPVAVAESHLSKIHM